MLIKWNNQATSETFEVPVRLLKYAKERAEYGDINGVLFLVQKSVDWYNEHPPLRRYSQFGTVEVLLPYFEIYAILHNNEGAEEVWCKMSSSLDNLAADLSTTHSERIELLGENV